MALINDLTLTGLVDVDNSATPVQLSVKVGFGQPANIGVRIDQQKILPIAVGDSTDYSLGTNAELGGKKLRIVAAVKDENDFTDESALEFTLTGTPLPVSNTLAWKITPTGGHVDYLVNLFFNRL